MRDVAKVIAGTSLLAMLAVAPFSVPSATAAGSLPSEETCKTNPADPATQGGCVVLDRKKGNCLACHQIAGASAHGDIAPPLVNMQQRYPDRTKLRAQIWDAAVANPNTVMPPFGKFGILSEEEINKVVDFVSTL